MNSVYNKNLFIKKYIINSITIDLYVKIKLYRNVRNNGYTLKIRVPFPKEYPITDLKEELSDLFEAFVTIYDTNMDPFKPIEDTDNDDDDEIEEDTEVIHNTSLEHIDKIKEVLGMGYIENIIYIESFYIFSRRYNIRERPDERSMLRGLGKTVICKVFNEILTTKFEGIKELNSIVLLEAGGGGVITDEDYVRYDRYSNMNKNELLDFLKVNYSEFYDEEFQDYNESWDVPLTLVTLENNKNLSAYYTNMYGFKLVTFESLLTPMVVSLYTFLEKCSS